MEIVIAIVVAVVSIAIGFVAGFVIRKMSRRRPSVPPNRRPDGSSRTRRSRPRPSARRA